MRASLEKKNGGPKANRKKKKVNGSEWKVEENKSTKTCASKHRRGEDVRGLMSSEGEECAPRVWRGGRPWWESPKRGNRRQGMWRCGDGKK